MGRCRVLQFFSTIDADIARVGGLPEPRRPPVDPAQHQVFDRIEADRAACHRFLDPGHHVVAAEGRARPGQSAALTAS